MPLRTLCAAFALFFAAPTFATELELRYAAVERVIAEQLFSQEGRLYVRGSKTTKCKFAYLESPRVGSLDGRLRILARFSGRTALDMFGGCVGLGDSFDFTMMATPVVRNGALVLTDVKLSTPRDSYYIRRVRQALSSSFSKDFKIEIRDQARHLLELSSADGASPSSNPSSNPPSNPPSNRASDRPRYQRELTRFDLTGVRVQPDALVLEIDFRLVVK